MKPHHLFTALAVIAQPILASPTFAQPAAWTVDKAKSKVGFSGSYTGSTFNGAFGKWDATIHFDPADLAGSSAKVTFSTASAATGDSTKDSALAEEDWLNPQKFPSATFTSTSITSSGGNNYVAKGNLTLKGKTLPVTLPFSLAIGGNSATMKGTTTVDRLAYEIGTQADGSGTWVSKDIAITVEIVATR